MNRRNFFSRLGITAAAVVAAPTALAVIAEEKPWVSKADFDADKDFYDNAHEEWVETKEWIKGPDGWIYSKAELEAEWLLSHRMDRDLF